MLEQNKKTEVLSEIESFVNRLDRFGEDESKYNSEAIKSLNDLIEKCKVYANQFKLERQKTFGSYGNRGPNVDNIDINIDDFNIKKILPMVGQIWSEYGESLTDKIAVKLFRFLELSLKCCGAEPISITEVQKIFELGRSVLKSKINFTDGMSVLYVSGVFEKLIEVMLKSNLSDSEMLKIFDMLCDISFNHGDKVSCSAAIMRKKRVVFDVLKKCFLPWNYCKLKDIISVVAERVWDQAKIALNNDGNEITEQNAAGVIEGIFSILDGILQNMLEDEDIVDKNIVNIKIVNTDFKTILELAKNTLKQSLPTDKNFLCGWTYAQALHVIWDMNLLMMSEEQREQMDEMLKSLGLGSKNGEIVVIDEKVFNSLPSCSYINDAIEEAKDCAQSYYTAQVRNGSKIVEVNKTDDKDKNRQDNEYQKNNRENQYKKTEEIKNENPTEATVSVKEVKPKINQGNKKDNDKKVDAKKVNSEKAQDLNVNQENKEEDSNINNEIQLQKENVNNVGQVKPIEKKLNKNNFIPVTWIDNFWLSLRNLLFRIIGREDKIIMGWYISSRVNKQENTKSIGSPNKSVKKQPLYRVIMYNEYINNQDNIKAMAIQSDKKRF